MKILLLDYGGNFLDFALQCLKAGHEVKWFISPDKNNERLPIGDGLVERVSDWRKWMRWSELTVLSDNVKYIQALEPYRQYGYPIFGANKPSQAMELDRGVGQKIFEQCGIDTLPYKTFNDYDSAEAHVRKTMARLVSKPSGDADKALSYVSKSPQDMIYMLRRWKKLGKNKQPFILQEFCKGVEMAVGGWFGPGGWCHAISENWEHKKLMNDDKGVNTGEMGTVCRYVSKSKLADQVLFPLTDYLFSIDYRGYLDVAVIIDESGKPWPMEFTARFGWPHFQITGALHVEPAQWMRDLLDGYDSLKVSDDVSTGVVCAIPDFPYSKVNRQEVSGIPVYCNVNDPHIHPCEVKGGTAPYQVGSKIVDLPCWLTAGTYLLVATGTAPSVSASAKKAYKVLDGIEIPNSPMYRTDIGARLKKELPILQSHGYATGMTY